MSPDLIMTFLSAGEFLLSAILLFLFRKRQLHQKFRATGAYLGLRVAMAPFLLLTFYQSAHTQATPWCVSYFVLFWATYIASAILLFFVCVEIFRWALTPFVGLTKVGLLVFRWAAVVSLLLAFSGVSFFHNGYASIPDFAFGLMRSVSILELFLLAFLCICMNALQLSIRDAAFGIALGFGVMSSNDFIVSCVMNHLTPLTAPSQFVYEAGTLLSLGIWTLYMLLPQHERKPILIAADSPIYRWNEIASALGHTGTKVVVPQPSGSFFLTDVERVVEKVLARNMKGSETKL